MEREGRTLVVVLVAVLLAACDGGGGGDSTESATPEATDEQTGATEPTAVETTTADQPSESESSEPAASETTSGPVEEVTFSQVNVTMEVSGSFERSVELRGVRFASYGGDQPNVGISVFESSDTPTASWNLVFPIGTTSGETDESGAIYLAYSVNDDAGTEHVFFNAVTPGCSIRVDEASPDGVSGTWKCLDNAATGDEDVVVDARGTFSASP